MLLRPKIIISYGQNQSILYSKQILSQTGDQTKPYWDHSTSEQSILRCSAERRHSWVSRQRRQSCQAWVCPGYKLLTNSKPTSSNQPWSGHWSNATSTKLTMAHKAESGNPRPHPPHQGGSSMNAPPLFLFYSGSSGFYTLVFWPFLYT